MDEHTELRRALEIFVTENPDLERLESLLGEFNIFEALGAVRQELRHSDFLAFLLDPGQHHGLGDTFLKRLLQRVLLRADRPPVSAVEIDVADLEGALVLREWRNIDILIHDESSRLVCVIENKIGSGEHSNQLTRYREIVQREFPDCRLVLVYLTPDGADPSGEAYIPLAYGDIADMIDAVRVVRESTLGADVSALMRHYTTMLRRHILTAPHGFSRGVPMIRQSLSSSPQHCQRQWRVQHLEPQLRSHRLSQATGSVSGLLPGRSWTAETVHLPVECRSTPPGGARPHPATHYVRDPR